MTIISSITRVQGVGRKAFGVILHIGVVATLIVAIKYAVVYAVDTVRPASHWMVYQSVEPVQKRYKLGEYPTFRTKAIRFHQVDMRWNDVMKCRPTTGPLAGVLMHIGTPPASSKVRVGPAYLGYDTVGIEMDQSYKWLDGYWNWTGPLPIVPSICHLEAHPVLYPSFSVEPKSVPVPVSGNFEFFDPSEEGL